MDDLIDVMLSGCCEFCDNDPIDCYDKGYCRDCTQYEEKGE